MAENLQLSPDPAWMNTEGVTYNDPLMFDRSIVPGKTALYPTYRKKEDGTFQQYGPTDAQRLAKENKDYKIFDTDEEAQKAQEKYVSQLVQNQKPVSIGTTQKQTEALTPTEVRNQNSRLFNLATALSKRITNREDIETLITKLEDEDGIFDRETGALGGIDPTVILKKFEETFKEPLTTPGAELLKDYLREKVNRKNSDWMDGSPEAHKIAALFIPGLTRASAEAGGDLARVAGRVGHDTGQGVLGLAGMLLEEPIESLASLFTTDEGAKEFSRKVFTLSTYVDKPKPPKTTTGKFAEPTIEYGLALYTGGKILNSVGTRIGKHNRYLKNAVEAAKLDTPKMYSAMHTIGKEMVGGPIHISPENRLANYLQEWFPDNRIIKDLVGQPDDNAFMRAFRTSADSFLAGTAIAGSIPLIALTARGLYNWNKPIAEEIVKTTDSWLSKMKFLRPKDAADRITDGIELPKDSSDVLTEIEAIQKIQKDTLQAIKQERSKGRYNTRAVDKKLKERGLQWDNVDKQVIPIVEKNPAISPKNKKEIEEAIQKVLKNPDSLDLDKTIQEVLNVKRIHSTEDRVNYINQLAKIFEDSYFKKSKTNVEIEAQGKLIQDTLIVEVGEENLGSYYKNWANSTDQTPAMASAIRHYLVQEGKLWKASSDEITQLLANNTSPSPEQMADYLIDAYRFLGSMETDLKVANNIARTQQFRRHLIGADDKTLLQIVEEAAAADGMTGMETLINLAGKVSKSEDLLQLRSQLNNETGTLYKAFHGNKLKAQNGLLSNLTTIGGATLGMGSWMIQTGVETGIQVGLNSVGKAFYNATGKTWLGKGQGMTFTAAKAEIFGMTQAFGEVFLGKGYVKDSPIGQGADAFRTLETKSVGKVGQGHEVTSTMTPKGVPVKQRILGKEYTMSPGYNADLTKIFPEFWGLEHNQIGKILKVLANGYGFIHSAAGRTLIAEDQFFRNIFERREIHKLSVLRAEKLVVNELESAKQLAIESGEEIPTVSMKEYHRKVDHMYHKVLTNLPQDIADEAARVATEGLMQEKLPELLRKVERIRDTTSDLRAGNKWIAKSSDGTIDKLQSAKNTGENVLYGAGNVAINVPKNFVASQTNFLRTAVNIVNQQLYERGPAKLLVKIFANNRQRALLFEKNETFKQEVIAKTLTGTALLWYGASLGNNFDSDDSILYSKGIDSYDPDMYYLNKAEGSGGPEIIKKNSDGTETAFSLARIDPLNYSLMLGSIYGSYRQKYYEIMERRQLQPDGTYLDFEQDQIDRMKELDNKLFYALGNWATQLPMLKPIKNTAQAMFPQLSPLGGVQSYERRMAKELANWMVYLNPLENGLSSLRKATNRIAQPYRTYGPGFEEKEDRPFKSSNPGILTEGGGGVPEVREMAVHFKEFSTLFLQEYQELVEKMTIMDLTNVTHPKVGDDIVAAVDVEGNMIRHFPDASLNKAELGLKSIGLPFYPKVVQRNVTSELIIGLGLVGEKYSQAYKDPRKWKNKYTTGSVLTMNQRYAWAVYAGELNKETFNTPEFRKIAKNIQQGKYKQLELSMDKYQSEITVDRLLRVNNFNGFLKMLEEPENKELLDKLTAQGIYNDLATD